MTDSSDPRDRTTVTNIGTEELEDGGTDDGVWTARPDLDDDYHDEHADPANFGFEAAPMGRTNQIGCEPGRATTRDMADLSDLIKRQRTQRTGGDMSTVVPEIAAHRR